MYKDLPMKNLVGFILVLTYLAFTGATSFAKENEPVLVKVSPIYSITTTAKHSDPATVVSLNHSTISAEITGRSLKTYVEIGDTVKKGQKLLSLDCRNYTLTKKQALASLTVAKTQLNLAKKQLIRNRRLIKNGTIPREIFDKAEAAQQTAIADIELKNVVIETAQLAIDRCIIRAPFSGQITKRFVQKGQLVIATTPLFQLMQNNKVEIKSNLSPVDIQKLKNISQLEFVTNNQRFQIKVRSVIQEVNELTRTQEIRLTIPKGLQLAAGLSGRVEWTSEELMLPPDYILRRNGQLGVMLAKDIIEGVGHASFFVLNAAKEGQSAEIDLPTATLIITENQYRVKDGQQIKVNTKSIKNRLKGSKE